MKRSLVSLAAMAVAGAVKPQEVVSLFGAVDLRTPTLTPAELAAWSRVCPPSTTIPWGRDWGAGWGRGWGADEDVLVVGAHQSGKTMRLHWYQEEALAAMRTHAAHTIPWPYIGLPL